VLNYLGSKVKFTIFRAQYASLELSILFTFSKSSLGFCVIRIWGNIETKGCSIDCLIYFSLWSHHWNIKVNLIISIWIHWFDTHFWFNGWFWLLTFLSLLLIECFLFGCSGDCFRVYCRELVTCYGSLESTFSKFLRLSFCFRNLLCLLSIFHC